MSFLDKMKKMFSSQEQEDRASLSKKVQNAPNDPQARQKLGIFLMRQGEVVEGLDQLARCAVLYEKDGFAGKAIAVLRQMLKHDPGNNDFQKWIIRLLAQEGLGADAQVELRKAAGEPGRFHTDEQRLDFFRQVAEFLPKNPLPRLYLCDVLRGQKKFLEAVNELERAAPTTATTGMYAEFTERVRGLMSQAGGDSSIMESCGFLWISIGMREEGLPILDRLVEGAESAEGQEHAAAEMRDVLDAIRGGWDVAGAKAFSFTEAAEKLAAPSVPAAEVPQADVPPPGEEEPEGPSEEGYQEEENIVRSALGRLQAKVQEEIGDTDLDARYNLGIAYKEMGLLEEAAKEFRLAMQKAELLVGASSLLADTLSDQGDHDAAIGVLEETGKSGTLSEDERRDVRYHKGVLLSRAGREEEAREIFLALYKEMPGYRDVGTRTEAYRS